MYSGIIRQYDLKDGRLTNITLNVTFMAIQIFMRKNGEFSKKQLDRGYSAFGSSDERRAYIFGDFFCAITNQNKNAVERISTAAFLHDLDRDFSNDENARQRLLDTASFWFGYACDNYQKSAPQGKVGIIFATLGNLGFQESNYNYAVMLRKGNGGLSADIYSSVEWLEDPVKVKLPIAMQNYGIHYFNGDGVECNRELGKEWVQKAVDAGFPHAKEVLEKMNTLPEGQKLKDSGCYVATAVYGSYDCPQVRVLRRYRDYTLAESVFGRAFIRVYYCLSPTVVKWFGKKLWFNRFWRAILDRTVARLVALGIDDTLYEDR
jgi:TPR repeat protein